MKRFNYKKIISIVLIVLTLTLLLLIILNASSEPHIRFIDVEGGKENAEFLQQRIKIYFSRPVEKTADNKSIDFRGYIKIDPQIDFNLSWNGNTLNIIPKNTLDEDTEYKLDVLPGFKDVYGNTIEDKFEYTFKTKALNFAYLEKNYPAAKDKVISRDAKNTNSKVLAEDNNIKQYSINKDYITLITINSDLTNTIKIINLKDNSTKDLSFNKASVSKIDLSNTLNAFIYIYQQVEPKGQFLQPLSGNLIKIYDLSTGAITDFNPQNTASDVMDASFSPDGKSILYRSSDSYYFLAPLDNSSDPISIGKYTGTGGFNFDGTKIIFTSYDPLATYSSFPFVVIFTSDRKTINITDPANYIVDPKFFNKDDNILFGEKDQDLLGSQGIFKIVNGIKGEASVGDYTFKDSMSDSVRSLELPMASWDDNYIITERYGKEALLDYQNQRSFINQAKPYKADLVIFDLKNNTILTEVKNGIDAKWLR
ncbi:MAG: Ig-like domain-containing protein [Candidatus Dojkabacteria bacterium]